MKRRKITIAGVVLLTLLILWYLNSLLAPTWTSWNNDNTIKGIYQEPKDRVQVLFLGTSQVVTGISPTYLYDQYGICSYDLGTEQQPLLSSYYLLKEMNRLHDETLSVAVLNVSYLFLDESEFENEEKLAFNEKALMNLRFSPVKVEAISALAKQYDSVNVLEYLFPVIRYHSRWASVTSDDFKGLSTADNRFFTRGQYLFFTRAQDSIPDSQLLIPDYSLTPEIDYSDDEISASYSALNKEYLDLIVDYCKDSGIDLVFMRIAKKSDDLQRDAVASLADQYGVPLIDFNDVSLQERIGLNFPTDYADNTHPNIWGSEKITDYVGEYLRQNYDIADIRGDARYDYLKAQRDEYLAFEENRALSECDDLLEYLDLIGNERYCVFFAAKDDAYSHLPTEAIAKMESLGLSRFTEMAFRSPYIGVLDSGEVLVDECSEDVTEVLSQEGSFGETYSFSISSSGFSGKNLTSIKINNREYSQNLRGLNIVVYDKESRQVVDATCFDTYYDCSRYNSSLLTKDYILRVDSARIDSAADFDAYAEKAMDDSHFLIICENMISPRSQKAIEIAGVAEKYGAAKADEAAAGIYICVIEDGTVIREDIVKLGEDTYSLNIGDNRIGLYYSPKHALIIGINEQDYSVPKNDALLLVYNNDLKAVVSTRS